MRVPSIVPMAPFAKRTSAADASSTVTRPFFLGFSRSGRSLMKVFEVAADLGDLADEEACQVERVRSDVARGLPSRPFPSGSARAAAASGRGSSPGDRSRGSGGSCRGRPSRSASSPASPPARGGSCGRPCGRRRPSGPRRAWPLASLTVLASGFSQRTALPARAAAMAIWAWLSPGVLTSTRSMSFRRTTSRQSVAASSHPRRPAASLTPSALAAAEDLEARREARGQEGAHLPVGVAVGPAHEVVADERDVDFLHRPTSLPSHPSPRPASCRRCGRTWPGPRSPPSRAAP